MFAAPPGLPDPTRTRLVEVVQKALNDRELAAWAKKVNFPLDIGTADDARRLYSAQRVFLTKYRQFLKGE